SAKERARATACWSWKRISVCSRCISAGPGQGADLQPRSHAGRGNEGLVATLGFRAAFPGGARERGARRGPRGLRGGGSALLLRGGLLLAGEDLPEADAVADVEAFDLGGGVARGGLDLV